MLLVDVKMLLFYSIWTTVFLLQKKQIIKKTLMLTFKTFDSHAVTHAHQLSTEKHLLQNVIAFIKYHLPRQQGLE